MVRKDDLFHEIWISVERILAGFAMGAIPGVIVGLLMGISWPVRAFLMPIATAIYAIPKILAQVGLSKEDVDIYEV